MSRNYGTYARNIENIVYKATDYKSKRLNYCNAEIIFTQNGKNIFLQSYCTIVAHLTEDNRCVAYGTYSATTVQHIYKFARKFNCTELIFVDNDTAEIQRIVKL